MDIAVSDSEILIHLAKLNQLILLNELRQIILHIQ